MSAFTSLSVPSPPQRPETGHKGTFGRVLIVGGSPGMSGAAALCATAALRSGSGLVTAAVPRSTQAIVASIEPSYTTLGLECDSAGELSAAAAAQVVTSAAGMNAVAIGPGLGRSSGAIAIVERALAEIPCRLVLDADALNILATRQTEGHFRSGESSIVVTPHPGEFQRLTATPVSDDEDRRIQAAAEFARLRGVVTVLKGHRTIVTDGKALYINQTGNSGMATGGTGDVLTGVLVSLLGQGMSTIHAAALAVHVHGLAGDLAADELSARGLIASDLIRFLPCAWRSLESTSS
ncbi:MAG: NAD(P)H-hydrate dehydratase [Planctomycetaceae bacterium]|nr:NAD(P)H-hydrate dehydratase [Planctomycetaceae bacterium]